MKRVSKVSGFVVVLVVWCLLPVFDHHRQALVGKRLGEHLVVNRAIIQ
jgi:hypothetical protein